MFDDYFIPFIILLGICFYNYFQNDCKRREQEMKELAKFVKEYNNDKQ